MNYHFAAVCVIALSMAACGSGHEEKNQQKQTMDMTTVDITPPLYESVANASPPPLAASSVYPIANEQYNSLVENEFKSSKANPLSTFAIDVDGASYANVRRMLMEGYLPPSDAVRTEEFINYFSYTYPQPTNGQPFSINSEYSTCPWNSQHQLLQIGIKGKEVDLKSAPNNNLVFLIDVSGSMDEPDKLPLLKRAFKLLVNQLREDDQVSIVVYAGNAGVVLDGADGDEPEKIINAFDQLQAGGSTAGGEGIELAYKLAKDHFIKKGNNRIILATDGDFNVGMSSQNELEKLIEEKREEGIYLSVFGFGQGNIQDNIMETLADKGNGNYNYIDNFMEARKVLVSQFGGTLITIAKDVKIQVEFNPQLVKEYRLIGYENRALNAEDFNDDKKDAGEIGSGHCVTALYEIIPFGSTDSKVNVDDLKYRSVNTNPTEVATVKFRYKGVNKKDTTSQLLSKAIHAEDFKYNTSPNLKLAAGVTEFAMLLRDSKHKQKASFEQSIALVSAAKANDSEGYITGLIEMIKIAKELKVNPEHLH
ncbi:MAG: VWA domain-containing protein [Bacteroidota bacterium]